MKKFVFPIPIEEIATKTYVDEKVGSEVKLYIGIVREEQKDEFKTLREGQQGLAEHLDRFELGTGQRFKFVHNRLDDIVFEMDSKFDLVISEIRGLKEKIS
jgi:hypothetical protein